MYGGVAGKHLPADGNDLDTIALLPRPTFHAWDREEYPGLRGGDGIGKSVLNCAVGRDRSLPCPNAAGASSCGDGVLAGAEVEGCLDDVNPIDPLDPGMGSGRVS